MGFYVAKSVSLAWALLKLNDKLPIKVIPFERQIQWVLLAGLVGFLSVKKGKMAARKEVSQASSELVDKDAEVEQQVVRNIP